MVYALHIFPIQSSAVNDTALLPHLQWLFNNFIFGYCQNTRDNTTKLFHISCAIPNGASCWRPIGIQNSMMVLIETMMEIVIRPRLNGFNGRDDTMSVVKGMLSDFQTGFIPGMGPEHSRVFMHHVLHTFHANKKPLAISIDDISHAYNSVMHDVLWEKADTHASVLMWPRTCEDHTLIRRVVSMASGFIQLGG